MVNNDSVKINTSLIMMREWIQNTDAYHHAYTAREKAFQVQPVQLLRLLNKQSEERQCITPPCLFENLLTTQVDLYLRIFSVDFWSECSLRHFFFAFMTFRILGFSRPFGLLDPSAHRAQTRSSLMFPFPRQKFRTFPRSSLLHVKICFFHFKGASKAPMRTQSTHMAVTW